MKKDEVIKQLKEIRFKAENWLDEESAIYAQGYLDGIDKVIEIFKRSKNI